LNLLFFDLGSGEIMLIVLAIFLIFGPDKIPEMACNLGKFINEVKRASEDIKTEINKEADKKEREKKLQEYKLRMQNPEPELKSQPRTTSTPANEPEAKTGNETVVNDNNKTNPENNATQ